MTRQPKINVGGLDFEWDLSRGRFLFGILVLTYCVAS